MRWQQEELGLGRCWISSASMNQISSPGIPFLDLISLQGSTQTCTISLMHVQVNLLYILGLTYGQVDIFPHGKAQAALIAEQEFTVELSLNLKLHSPPVHAPKDSVVKQL